MSDRRYAKVHAFALVLILAALVFGMLWAPPWAPRPVAHAASSSTGYTAGKTVHVWYSVDRGLWDFPAAVKAAGVRNVKLRAVDALDVILCDENHRKGRRCAMVWSSDAPAIECRAPWRDVSAPAHVCMYGRRGQPITAGKVYDSTLDLNDNAGRKLTKAQRHQVLTAAVRRLVARR